MKRYTSLLILALIATGLCAQNQNKDDARKKRWEEMKAKRAAFYTERMCLTAEDAQVFWPIYNELQDKKGALRHQMEEQFKSVKKDANGCCVYDYKTSDDMVNALVQEALLTKKYHAKFRQILSPVKLYKYYWAERDWAKILLKEMEKGR